MFILMSPIRPFNSPLARSFNYVYSPYSPRPTAIYINEPFYGPYSGSAFRNCGNGFNPYGYSNFGYGFNNGFMNPFFAVQNFQNSIIWNIRNFQNSILFGIRNFQNSFFNPFGSRFSSPYYSSPRLSYGQAFGPGFFVGSPYTQSPVGYYGVGPGLSNFDYWGTYLGRYNSPFTNPFLFNRFNRYSSCTSNFNLGTNFVAAQLLNNNPMNGLNYNPAVIANA